MDVKNTMTRKVIFVEPLDRLPLVHRLMVAYQFRHLPVLEHGKLVGILSDRDVLRWSAQEDGALNVPDLLVADVMEKQVITCLPKSSVSKAAELMASLQIDALPVVNKENELMGMVTSTDLLELLSRSDEGVANRLLPFSFEVTRASVVDV